MGWERTHRLVVSMEIVIKEIILQKMKGNRLKNRQKPLKTDFVTLSISSSYKQAPKRASFAL